MPSIASDNPEPRDAESDLDPGIVKVSREERGWFVEHEGRIGPFFAKKTATDVAADWVAALRAAGESAGLLLVEPRRTEGD